MGCHTWFYTKTDITLDQAKKDALEICNHQIEWHINEISNPSQDMLECYSDWVDKLDYNLALFERYKRFIEKNLFKGLKTYSEFYSHGFDRKLTNYVSRTDSVYVEVEDIHDIFRLGGYPEDQLLSFKETLEYCQEKRCKISMEQFQSLLDFWNKYPEGMIKFG